MKKTALEQRADDLIHLLTIHPAGMTLMDLCKMFDRRPASIRPAITRARKTIAEQTQGKALVCVRDNGNYTYLIATKSRDAADSLHRNGKHVQTRIKSELRTLIQLNDGPTIDLCVTLMDTAAELATQHMQSLTKQALPAEDLLVTLTEATAKLAKLARQQSLDEQALPAEDRQPQLV